MLQAEVDLLVISAQQNNEAALHKLFSYFNPQLVRFAYRLTSDHASAQDIVQEVWIKTAKTIRSIQDPRAFKSWIFRAVRWQVTDNWRTKKAQPLEEHELDNESGATLDDSSLHNQMLSKLINQLAPIDAQTIHLFYLEEMTLQEIAHILEIPIGTVKSRLYRSRESLKAMFEQSLQTGEAS